MSEGILAYARIPATTRSAEMTREKRTALVSALTDFRISLMRTRPLEEAIVTRGGVLTREINPQTMESRIVPGLFFAGEVIDIDAKTGGYNLQAAFSTGWAAGKGLAG